MSVVQILQTSLLSGSHRLSHLVRVRSHLDTRSLCLWQSWVFFMWHHLYSEHTLLSQKLCNRLCRWIVLCVSFFFFSAVCPTGMRERALLLSSTAGERCVCWQWSTSAVLAVWRGGGARDWRCEWLNAGMSNSLNDMPCPLTWWRWSRWLVGGSHATGWCRGARPRWGQSDGVRCDVLHAARPLHVLGAWSRQAFIEQVIPESEELHLIKWKEIWFTWQCK